ncbi:hypothetical protein CEXT_446111, partial [Caerostris extrusa]
MLEEETCGEESITGSFVVVKSDSLVAELTFIEE